MTNGLRQLYLGHLSRECNRPALAMSALRERADRIGAKHVCLELTAQDIPCPTLQL